MNITFPVVDMNNASNPVTESTWLYQAQEFIKGVYCDWENGKQTRLVPPVEDEDVWIQTAKTLGASSERKLIIRLFQLGKRNGLPMFITYNRDFSHLVKTRNIGGGIEGVLETGEQDIIIIHRDFGVIFIEVKNLDIEQTGKKLGDAVKRNIKTAEDQLQKDVHSLEHAVKECGVENMILSLHVIALTNLKRGQLEDISNTDRTIFLCEEDYLSVEAMEQWWQKYVLQLDRVRNFPIDSMTYLQLLAM